MSKFEIAINVMASLLFAGFAVTTAMMIATAAGSFTPSQDIINALERLLPSEVRISHQAIISISFGTMAAWYIAWYALIQWAMPMVTTPATGTPEAADVPDMQSLGEEIVACLACEILAETGTRELPKIPCNALGIPAYCPDAPQCPSPERIPFPDWDQYRCPHAPHR